MNLFSHNQGVSDSPYKIDQWCKPNVEPSLLELC